MGVLVRHVGMRLAGQEPQLARPGARAVLQAGLACLAQILEALPPSLWSTEWKKVQLLPFEPAMLGLSL